MARVAFAAIPDARSLRALNYRPEVEKLRRKKGVPGLNELVSELGLAQGSRFTRAACDPGHGVEQLSQADMFSSEPAGSWLRRDSFAHPERHEIRKWQVLISGAGQMHEGTLFGQAIVADDRLTGKYVGGDAVNLTFHREGGPENLAAYAYMCSKPGLSAIKSCAYGTSIPRIRLDLLAALPVPVPTQGLADAVASLVSSAVEARATYSTHIAAARAVFETQRDIRDAQEMCSNRRAHCVAWSDSLPSLCAWNYASAGPALAELRRRWPLRVRDVIRGIKAKNRFSRIPCAAPHGVELASQRDIFMMRRLSQRVVKPQLPDSELYADPSTLLIARDGQHSEGSLFGRAELARAGLTNTVLSEHIMQVQCDERDADWLFSFITTHVGQSLIRTTAVGTSIPTIREDLLLDLPLPDLDRTDINTVSGHIDVALRARAESEESEAKAIRIIEDEVIPRWLA